MTEKYRSKHQTWPLDQEAGAKILNHKQQSSASELEMAQGY